MDKKVPNGLLKLPEVGPLSYEFGGMTPVSSEILFPEGRINDHLPEDEMQIGVYFDDYGCVGHSQENGHEAVIDRKLESFSQDNKKWLKDNFLKNGKINFSDRDLIVLSGTKPGVGNSAEKVLQTSQKIGLIPQSFEDWDFKERDPEKNNQIKYYAYARTKADEEIAAEWNKRFEIIGEFVHISNLEQASKEGAIQLYVRAWHYKDGKYYNPTPGKYNHAVLLCDYKKIEIYDSYDPFIKPLSSWNDCHEWALKLNIIEKTMKKPNINQNSLVIMTEGGGNIGLFLDGRIIVDDPAKIQTVYNARTLKEITIAGTKYWVHTAGSISLTKEQWDMFEKRNLKMEPIS